MIMVLILIIILYIYIKPPPQRQKHNASKNITPNTPLTFGIRGMGVVAENSDVMLASTGWKPTSRLRASTRPILKCKNNYNK